MKTSFKRAFGLILVLTLVCTLLFAFTACDVKPETEKGAKTATLIVVNAEGAETVITDDTDCEYVADWLIELNTEKKITLAYENTQYGMNVTSLNGITVGSATSSYFAFYSDDADNAADSEYIANFVRGEITYKPALLGQSSMPVKNGKTYVLKYSAY